MEDYLDFLEGVFLARITRDMNCSCADLPPPELWLDIELEHIQSDPAWAEEEKQHLMLTGKVADLIDDRKKWLFDEVREDVRRMKGRLIP